jgi:hypothetical protein
MSMHAPSKLDSAFGRQIRDPLASETTIQLSGPAGMPFLKLNSATYTCPTVPPSVYSTTTEHG